MKFLQYIVFTLSFFLFLASANAQKIFIDPGHGYTSTGSNPDGRTATEIETALSVGLKMKTLIDNNCTWQTNISRTVNVGGWVSLATRQSMSDSWGADYFLSIHCNAGGGTGTETFWCNQSNPPNTTNNVNYAVTIQNTMVTGGQWFDRRVVEDDSYLPFHLGVLTGNQAHSCLSEIGFVDSAGDATKLLSNSWRDIFAQVYVDAIEAVTGTTCNTACPGNLSLNSTNLNGTYVSGGTITSTGQVPNGNNCIMDASSSIILDPGFDAANGCIFDAKIGGCQ